VFLLCSPSYTLSSQLPPSYWYQLPRQDLFYLPVLHFCKRKWHFCLFKIGTQGVSLWYFHAYIITTQIGSSPLFFSFLP
jgi:hypothetical protein